MTPLKPYPGYLLVISLLSVLAACSGGSATKAPTEPLATLDIYKSQSCQCCGHWIQHAENAGFEAKEHHPADLNAVKRQYGIAPRYQSCHLAVSSQGYVFEGHIPAHFIQQFLDKPPAGAIGLSVPGMPLGSPGMEVDDRFTPYQVLLLKNDGHSEVYARVDTAAQQYPEGSKL